MGSQVLAFVNQDQGFLEAAAADIVHGLELDVGLFLHVLNAPGRIFIVQVQRLDIVVDSPQPGVHFFLFGTGKETMLFRQWRRRPGGDDLVETLLFHRHFDGGRQRQNGFPGPRGPGEGDQVHIRIH